MRMKNVPHTRFFNASKEKKMFLKMATDIVVFVNDYEKRRLGLQLFSGTKATIPA